MNERSRRKIFERLKEPEYSLLHKLTDDGQALDAASLQGLMRAAVDDRFKVARGMLEAARLLLSHENVFVRRSAASRAYYAVYHAARATVFAVNRHDEHDHEKLPGVINSVVKREPPIGEQLRDLKRRRQEADYSSYPGPPHSGQHSMLEYDESEFDGQIQDAVDRAGQLVDLLDAYVQTRRTP